MKRTFLYLSTAHVSEATANWLDAQGEAAANYQAGPDMPEIHIAKHVYGWFFYADEPPDEAWPADLRAVMAYVRQQGCEYVNMDRDADTIDALPVHDW